jgi:hypothetical protein
MTALLRAEWLRFRRRKDLWVIGIAVLVIGGLGFLNGYKQDVTDPPRMTESEIRQMFSDPSYFGFDPENPDGAPTAAQIEEMVAQQVADQDAQLAESDASQLITLQKYDLVQSPMTMIGFGVLPLIALLIVTLLIVGDEFRFGTVRTSLIAASPRRRFLVARLVTIATIQIGLVLALAVLAIVLSGTLRLVGAELPPATIHIDLVAWVATVLAEILAGFAILALVVALTVLVRSGAIPLLLVLIALAADVFVTSLLALAFDTPLVGVAQFSLTASIRSLVSTLGSSTGALAFAGLEPAPAAIAIPTWGVALIVAAWLALFLAFADRRFRTMDIVE